MRKKIFKRPIIQPKTKSPTVLGTIDYKNVVLLRKFISAEGKILSRRLSKLSANLRYRKAKFLIFQEYNYQRDHLLGIFKLLE